MKAKKEGVISLRYSGFPSHTISESEKGDEKTGLQVGNSVEYEWFNRNHAASTFYSRWQEFHRRRLYARAEQPTQKYKNEMASLGDLSFLSLDWKPVPIMPKLVDIVVNGMQERQLKPKVEAVDPMSQEMKSEFQDNIEAQMASKDLLLRSQELFGIDPFTMNPDEVPENDEQMELYMQLNYKPAIEIAQEISISTILEENRYDEIRQQLDYNQVVLGVGFVYHEFKPGEGISVRAIDPANVIHSYTDDPYFSDCWYWGHVEHVPISEIKKIKPDVSDDDIEEIQRQSIAWYDYHSMSQFYQDTAMRENTATLIYFSYKTTKRIRYKKKKKNGQTVSYVEKDENWNPPPEVIERAGDFEVFEKEVEVWYDGIKVAGTDIMLKWELQENMVRPRSATQKSIPRYCGAAPRMYKGRIDSLVARMIQFADLIQITHLKIQQVVAKTVPDGVYIDADGLTNVDLGDGGEYNPGKALKLYLQTGSVVGRSKTVDDEFNHGRIPIQELGKNSGASKIQSLIGNYNHYMTMMSQVAGLNQATDGSSPDERSLVGVQKLAALNSNTATRHIIEAGISIFKRVCEAVSLRLSDAVKYSEEFAEELVNKIGKNNFKVISEVKNIHLHSFGIHIEISPDAEQRERLDAAIDRALEKENIDLEDAIDVREIPNIKLANQLLKMKRMKKQQREQKMKADADARQHQANMAQIQESTKAAKAKAEIEAKSKIAVIKAEGEVKMEGSSHEKSLKEQLMELEFLYNMQLKGLEVEGRKMADEVKQKYQDKRQDKIATQQSKLIDQRKRETGPIDFESNEDHLGKINIGEFEPR